MLSLGLKKLDLLGSECLKVLWDCICKKKEEEIQQS